ncbi:hypothetical protein M2163_009137 [Streptomyces sp. SAI-135]|uniref:DUF5994 family protein n=1 Tax=unclassified Streptomyces TaxID=2593676 RepID=UPI002475FBF1|nr:DUF5994 family protein [Streptomyces sp. SAI-135]MDH6622029.1 hypothetical protein [Streptomyces sp. SAI-135]
MSAITDHPSPRAVPFRAPTARLALRPMSPCPGQVELDGAWWPHSRDLSHELPALADVLDPLWGRITRIAVNPRYWPIIPQRIFVNGHVVKVGWFTTQLDPHKILLLSGTSGRWDLLVIPPEVSAPSAARLMAAASASTAPQPTATALMTAELVDAPSTSADAGTGWPDRPAAVAQPSAPPPQP